MRERDVPIALGGGFVVVETGVNFEGNALQSRGELEIGRRIEHRIAAEDQQSLNVAGDHVAHELC